MSQIISEFNQVYMKELRRYFGVNDESEILRAIYKCSLKKKVSMHIGRLYLTNRRLFFYGKNVSFPLVEVKKAWYFDSIIDLDRKSNSLLVFASHSKKYVFVQFENLDVCYKVIKKTLFGIYGNSALHVAVKDGNYVRAREILNLDLKKLNLINIDQQTPFHQAFLKNDIQMVRLLMMYYARNDNMSFILDKNKNTFLHIACSMTDISDDILNMLLNITGVSVEASNEDGNTPLHYFCEYNNSFNCEKLITLIISKALNQKAYLARCNCNNETVLHKACFNKRFRMLIVGNLIKYDIDINAKNNKGETPLHYAVRLLREDLCKLLLKAGADPFARTVEGLTPLDMAEKIHQENEGSQSAMVICKLLRDIEEMQQILKKAGLLTLFHKFILKRWYGANKLMKIDENMFLLYNIPIKMGSQIKFLREMKKLRNSKVKSELESIKTSQMSRLASIDFNLLERIKNDEKIMEENFAPNDFKIVEIDESELEFAKRLECNTCNGKMYRGLYRGKQVIIRIFNNLSEDEVAEKKELIMAKIQSPYLVSFYGISLSSRLILVSEYCSRDSLYSILSRISLNINWDLAFSFVIDIAMGIKSLNQVKVEPSCSYLKLRNLLLTSDLRVKISDLGQLRAMKRVCTVSFEKNNDTLIYCAPEIFNGEKSNGKSDIYSFGIILWEIVYRTLNGTYKQPYAEFYNVNYNFQIMLMVSQGIRPTIPESLPESFSDLIKDCLLGDAKLRPTIDQVITRLEGIINEYKRNKEVWEALLLLNSSESIHQHLYLSNS